MRTPDEIRQERRQLARQHDGRFPEQATERVDDLVENARARAAGGLMEIVAQAAADGEMRLCLPADAANPKLPQLALLYLMQTPEFEKWLRERTMEVVETFATDVSRDEYERRLAALEHELGEAERAARQAPILAQRDALDQELAALE